MTVSLDEFRTRARPVSKERLPEFKAAVQESVRAAALTGHPAWDWFLRHVEANIKATERVIEAKRNQAAALVLLDEPKAKAAAVMVTALEARRETLLELILLPKWIIENGDAASKLVAELEALV